MEDQVHIKQDGTGFVAYVTLADGQPIGGAGETETEARDNLCLFLVGLVDHFKNALREIRDMAAVGAGDEVELEVDE